MSKIEVKIPYVYKAKNGKEVFIEDTDGPLFLGSVQNEGNGAGVAMFHPDGTHVYDEKLNLIQEVRKIVVNKPKK